MTSITTLVAVFIHGTGVAPAMLLARSIAFLNVLQWPKDVEEFEGSTGSDNCDITVVVSVATTFFLNNDFILLDIIPAMGRSKVSWRKNC